MAFRLLGSTYESTLLHAGVRAAVRRSGVRLGVVHV
jgi:hypothetical protein